MPTPIGTVLERLLTLDILRKLDPVETCSYLAALLHHFQVIVGPGGARELHVDLSLKLKAIRNTCYSFSTDGNQVVTGDSEGNVIVLNAYDSKATLETIQGVKSRQFVARELRGK